MTEQKIYHYYITYTFTEKDILKQGTKYHYTPTPMEYASDIYYVTEKLQEECKLDNVVITSYIELKGKKRPKESIND